MSLVCLGVYNKWPNSYHKRPHPGSKGGKKHPHAYFIDENGKFYQKRVTKAEAIKLKLSGIFKQRVAICQNCGYRFFKLIKKESDKVNCPSCGGIV